MRSKLNVENFIENVVEWLKDYAQNAGVNGFVVGVSGGVDSAVVSTLCARTGMPVLCVEMPIHQDPSHTSRSSVHIAWLKEQFPGIVTSAMVELTEAFDVTESRLLKSFPNGSQPPQDKIKLAEANTRSRLRMIALYYYANSMRLLVTGTGNKVEDFGTFFFSRGGDGQIDLSPLADIMKTEVWAVASALGVNQDIIDAKPTDGLWVNSPTDEDTIGASYPELEWAMDFLEEIGGDGGDDLIYSLIDQRNFENSDRRKEVMRIFLSRNRAGHFKSEPIPVFDASECRVNTYSTAQ